jgi:hypothetical protein
MIAEHWHAESWGKVNHDSRTLICWKTVSNHSAYLLHFSVNLQERMSILDGTWKTAILLWHLPILPETGDMDTTCGDNFWRKVQEGSVLFLFLVGSWKTI